MKEEFLDPSGNPVCDARVDLEAKGHNGLRPRSNPVCDMKVNLSAMPE